MRASDAIGSLFREDVLRGKIRRAALEYLVLTHKLPGPCGAAHLQVALACIFRDLGVVALSALTAAAVWFPSAGRAIEGERLPLPVTRETHVTAEV